jgi:hypothetical protein
MGVVFLLSSLGDQGISWLLIKGIMAAFHANLTLSSDSGLSLFEDSLRLRL